MAKLPRDVSGDEARGAFERAGWIFHRQAGSHMILYHHELPLVTLSIPRHSSLKPGTLRKLIRLSGMTVERFIELL